MLRLPIALAFLATAVLAAPHTPTRTVQERAPHPPLLTLPTPGTYIEVPVSPGPDYPAGYFQFPVILTDFGASDPAGLARVALQNSSGTYVIGSEIKAYDTSTFEAFVSSTASIVAPGNYTLEVQTQSDETANGWVTAASTNVIIYYQACGIGATC